MEAAEMAVGSVAVVRAVVRVGVARAVARAVVAKVVGVRAAAAMVEVVRAACTPEGRNPYSPYRMGRCRTLHLHRRPGSCHRLWHYTL